MHGKPSKFTGKLRGLLCLQRLFFFAMGHPMDMNGWFTTRDDRDGGFQGILKFLRFGYLYLVAFVAAVASCRTALLSSDNPEYTKPLY